MIPQYFKLKTWEELALKYGEFINEDNFNQPEIYVKDHNFYLPVEYKNISGRFITSDMQTMKDQVFVQPLGRGTDEADWIHISCIKRRANAEDDPEMML